MWKLNYRLEKIVKYLGLPMDQKLLFEDHAIKTSKKILDIVRKLGYILRNIRVAKELRRKLLFITPMSRVLYGSLVGPRGWENLHRKNLMRYKEEPIH